MKAWLLSLALALVTSLARAEAKLLYWMIDSNNQYEFEYAVVYAAPTANLDGKSWTAKEGYGDIGAIALPKEVEGGFGYDSVKPESTTTRDILTELGETNWAAYSFYIELVQWDDSIGVEIRKGVSEVASYNDLMANHHVLGSDLTIPENLVVWAPRTTPEPTSAILLLVGCAALALRRRP